ncbi:MAG: nitrilase-related carbon-nitrogen hydrolase, partial [bacterium]
MSDSINIGLIQREIIPQDPAGNLLATLEMMNACSGQGVDLFVLSEYWATGLINPVESETPDLIQDIDGPTVEALRDFCRESGSWICAGSLAIRRKNGITNTSLIIDPQGKIVLEYDKTQLFS